MDELWEREKGEKRVGRGAMGGRALWLAMRSMVNTVMRDAEELIGGLVDLRTLRKFPHTRCGRCVSVDRGRTRQARPGTWPGPLIAQKRKARGWQLLSHLFPSFPGHKLALFAFVSAWLCSLLAVGACKCAQGSAEKGPIQLFIYKEGTITQRTIFKDTWYLVFGVWCLNLYLQ